MNYELRLECPRNEFVTEIQTGETLAQAQGICELTNPDLMPITWRGGVGWTHGQLPHEERPGQRYVPGGLSINPLLKYK